MNAEYRGSYRAGIIGHTGRGNYGHGLDLAFAGLPRVTIAAVADADEAGRRGAMERTGAGTSYGDYREMLARERLDLVAVGPRHVDQREAMLLAAIEAGVKAIYTEKPFARSLDEADRILEAAQARGVKIAVAHQNRAFAAPRLAMELLRAGKIGRLRVMRGFGKQDQRGGGQDLMVLGTHLLDLMRLLAGDARWCHARVTQEGRDVGPSDAHPADEGAGLIAGDDVIAHYGFDGGVTGSYESMRAADGGSSDYFHLELGGTAGILAFWSSPTSPVSFYPRPFPLPDRPQDWQVVQPQQPRESEGAQTGTMHAGNQWLVCDLLATLERGGEPLSSAADARAALEMIMAVYESHRTGQRVPLPLERREHPLLNW
ncbi:MAG TPA: Gfo/Idh/MocA family oxidoreductase [Chloroflexota bacterium]|nr:Gfo/Idh/MocA family oxidoreductase [Chloroflexota bacterium]